MIQFYQHFLAFPVRSRFGENVMDMNDGLFLAVEANMTPRITENTESLNRGMAESKKVASGTDTIGSAEWNRVVLHDREKGVLQTIASDYSNGVVTNRCVLLIFGGNCRSADKALCLL